VYLKQVGSHFDGMESIRENEGYSIERLDIINEESIWVNVASSYAYGALEYIYEVSTLIDSNDVSIGLTQFRVITSMDEGVWISPSEIGYSVDNLAPLSPQGLTISMIDGYIKLEWDTSTEYDINNYNIYSRIFENNSNWEYEANTENSEILISYDLEYDLEYTITAVDLNANESDFSNIVSTMELILNDKTIYPYEFKLYPCYPNPFNPQTNIHYTIPRYQMVNITVFDLNGSISEIIYEGYQTAGDYNIIWDAGNKSSGIYLLKITAGNNQQNQKVLLLK